MPVASHGNFIHSSKINIRGNCWLDETDHEALVLILQSLPKPECLDLDFGYMFQVTTQDIPHFHIMQESKLFFSSILKTTPEIDLNVFMNVRLDQFILA